MPSDKTQNMVNIAHELGELSAGVKGLNDKCGAIFGKLDDMQKNGLPMCASHEKRVDGLEARINHQRATVNGDSMSWGKWKLSGIAVVAVSIILAMGWFSIKLAEVLKPTPYNGPRRTAEQPAQPSQNTVKTP
jgi:hypothetical protein